MGALTPITKDPTVRRFKTYDLEWLPARIEVGRQDDGTITDRQKDIGQGVRLCGCYDGNKGYRSYRKVADFIEAEFTAECSGWWFYAHAGGLADIQFLFDYFLHNENYQIQASFSGSSAIIVKVTRGNLSWYCIDSYWLLRDKLANIARSVGLKKLNDYTCPEYPACGHQDPKTLDPKCIFYAPDSELIPYNEQDCYILWKAIHEFETTILSIGGQLQKTIASTAMELFRRKYLPSKIETTDDINLLARQAYTSSRVEVFRRDCVDGKYYDINSSFPFSMTKPHPGQVIRRDRKLPARAGAIYLAECEIAVPKTYLPPLPYRSVEGRVYFPTGRWRAWFSSVDLELLQKRGGTIHRVFDVVHFEPRTDLAGYAYDIYERRLDAKKRGADFESLVYKYLLNSLYGKFAESTEKQTLHIRPEVTTCPHSPQHAGNSCVEVLQPGVIIVTDECEIPHMWVPISVHITALSRALLEEHLHTCQKSLYYCDTDSIITRQTLPTGDKLGDLKLEMTVDNGTFVAPKLYRVQGTELLGGGKTKAVHKVKAKGFRGLSVSEFQDLRDGIEVGIESMMRIRELLKRGHSSPTEKVFGKAFRGSTRPKRCIIDGDTRPWTTEEIDQKYKSRV